MRITYFSTLYKREITITAFKSVVFSDDSIQFASGGHEYEISLDLVRKIEKISE